MNGTGNKNTNQKLIFISFVGRDREHQQND